MKLLKHCSFLLRSPRNTDRPLLDWKFVRAKFGKKGVTMVLLWQEYMNENLSSLHLRFKDAGKGKPRARELGELNCMAISTLKAKLAMIKRK